MVPPAQPSAPRPPANSIHTLVYYSNRANVSKVLGELLMAIEAGHRDEPVQIPVLGRDATVAVPGNVYLIGMMNTADRGLALIDYALRRRFRFFEMEPAFGNTRFEEDLEGKGSAKLVSLAEKVASLNDRITEDPAFGSGFRIGHSYFCLDTPVSDEDVRDIVDFELDPLLREYWFDEPKRAESEIDALRAAI